MAVLTEREAREIVDRIMGAASADATVAALSSREGGNIRFANNGVTTSGEIADVTVRVTSAFGTRRGTAETNVVDPEALTEVVRRAEQAARRAPEDPEYVPPLAPVEYPRPQGWFDSTAVYGPDERAAAAAAAIGAATSREVLLAGFLENYATALATASSTGLFGYHHETWLEYTNTARTPDARG
jgi:predicted Zn-dependent protease